MKYPLLTGLLLMALWPFMVKAATPALTDIRVVGLFKQAAVFSIGGEQRMLRVGQQSPEGITLLAADAGVPTFELAGQTHRLGLARDIGARYQPPRTHRHHIRINARGQYLTPGWINNQSVTFLVDTGATAVAMNTQTARRLGIDFAAGAPGQASTAGGVVRSYRVTLARVKVGDIEVRNVEAAVLEGVHPGQVLLGMSYLSRVTLREQGGLLTLTQAQ